jgi:hypothetical protein
MVLLCYNKNIQITQKSGIKTKTEYEKLILKNPNWFKDKLTKQTIYNQCDEDFILTKDEKLDPSKMSLFDQKTYWEDNSKRMAHISEHGH